MPQWCRDVVVAIADAVVAHWTIDLMVNIEEDAQQLAHVFLYSISSTSLNFFENSNNYTRIANWNLSKNKHV